MNQLESIRDNDIVTVCGFEFSSENGLLLAENPDAIITLHDLYSKGFCVIEDENIPFLYETNWKEAVPENSHWIRTLLDEANDTGIFDIYTNEHNKYRLAIVS